jgi:hypothetical protein
MILLKGLQPKQETIFFMCSLLQAADPCKARRTGARDEP